MPNSGPSPIPGEDPCAPGGLPTTSPTTSPVPRPAPVSAPVSAMVTAGFVRWEAPSAESLREAFPGLRVVELAGLGGMSAVYRAEQSRLGRTVAVKILPPAASPNRETLERFEREARILSGLNHPHVLQIHDFGALADGTLYLVTEWAEKGDLVTLLDGKAHAPEVVLEWVRQIAAALTTAHARGVIHRDLKPGNVLVLGDGRLTLADFGLAYAGAGAFAATLTLPGSVFGTFEYMAPEQMEGNGLVTPAADFFALGVITYQMLTGRVPRGAYAKPSRIAKLPGEVDAFIDTALASDPLRRPPTAEAFVAGLERALRAPVRRRQRQLIGLGVCLVVLALAWARAEIIRSEREAAAEEARQAAMAAESRLAVERRARAAAVAAAEAALAASPFGPTEVGGIVSNGARPVRAEASTSPKTPEWAQLLEDLDASAQAHSGEWRMEDGALRSGPGRCALRLPARPEVNYDLAIEFTRESGKNSVAIFLPTLAGEGSFEVDAWDLGIGGVQLIDGEDLRKSGRFFPARIENGVRHRLVLEVRGHRLNAIWEGDTRRSWDLSGHRFRVPGVWQVGPRFGLGLGTWSSPTIFHRVAYRVWPADVAP